VRILLISAVLASTASCAMPPPQPQAAGPVAVAAAPAPTPLLPPPSPAAAPGPVAIAAPPPPAAVPVVYTGAPAAPDMRPTWPVWPMLFNQPAPPGRFTLSNFDFDGVRVQTVVTSAADCAPSDPQSAAEFYMPLNATRVIVPPRGQDVCWRRQVQAQRLNEGGTTTFTGAWAPWNRAFTASGRFIDSQL
jgi:hypothetical protein